MSRDFTEIYTFQYHMVTVHIQNDANSNRGFQLSCAVLVLETNCESPLLWW